MFLIRAPLICVALFFIVIVTQAQNRKKADSLIQVLNELDLEDSTKISLLNSISIMSPSPVEKIRYANQLITLSNKRNDLLSLSRGYHQLGVAYMLSGDIEKSLGSLFEAAKLADKNSDYQLLAETYSEIGIAYTQNNDTRNSLLYKSKAIEILRKTENRQVLAINLLNTGFSYYTINNLDTALSYYNEAEPIFEEIGLEIGKAYTIGNRALVYWKQGNPEQAKEDLFKAIEMLEPLGDRYGMADYYNQLGSIYLDQKQHDKAIEYTAKGLELAKSEDLKEQVRNASLLLYRLYNDKKEYKKALDYQTQYIAYKDSIQDQKTTQRLADLRTEYEVGQKQIEVDLLANEKRSQQWLSLGLGLFLLLVTAFLIVIYRNYVEKNKVNELLESQASQLHQQKSELEKLNNTKDKFFSIISHDLRGPVGSFVEISKLIRFYIENDNKEELNQATDLLGVSATRLSTLLDNLLSWALQQQGNMPNRPERVELDEVVINLFATFGNLAETKKIRLDSNIDGEVVIFADKNATQTVLRNLVNNSLKFTPSEGEIKVTGTTENNKAKIQVSDTGVGMPEDKVRNLFSLDENKSTHGTSGEQGIGLGLQLVHEFIKTNNGDIQVSSQEGVGTTFTIYLPLFEYDQKKVAKEERV